jgi:hypothetical protein
MLKLRDHLPWLCQGDIFENAPVVDVSIAVTGEVQAAAISGPAVLLTHDCDMDKPNRDGTPRVERLQFARLRAVDALPRDRQQTLRSTRDKIAPYEVLYLGEVPDFGKSFILFSDPYYFPTIHLEPSFVEYGSTGTQEGGRYLTAQKNDSRIGRIEAHQLALMRQKMSAFWARIIEDQSIR